MNNEIKVGDKVRVLSLESIKAKLDVYGIFEGVRFDLQGMSQFCGGTYTVETDVPDGALTLDGTGGWYFSQGMVEKIAGAPAEPAQEIQAIESLDRLRAQMLALVETGVFGPHKPDGCLICPANRIIDDIEALMSKMQPDKTKQ